MYPTPVVLQQIPTCNKDKPYMLEVYIQAGTFIGLYGKVLYIPNTSF